MSLGALAEDEVEGMRPVRIPYPTLDKIIALAGAFGVDPAYFLDWGEQPPIIYRGALEILQDETTSAIARESFRLPPHERQMILNIIRQLEDMRGAANR